MEIKLIHIVQSPAIKQEKDQRGKKFCDFCHKKYSTLKREHLCKRCIRSMCAECYAKKMPVVLYQMKVGNSTSASSIKAHKVCQQCNQEMEALEQMRKKLQLYFGIDSSIIDYWLDRLDIPIDEDIPASYNNALRFGPEVLSSRQIGQLNSFLREMHASKELINVCDLYPVNYSFREQVHYLILERSKVWFEQIVGSVLTSFLSLYHEAVGFSLDLFYLAVYLLCYAQPSNAWKILCIIYERIVPSWAYPVNQERNGRRLDGRVAQQLVDLIVKFFPMERALKDKYFELLQVVGVQFFATVCIGLTNFQLSYYLLDTVLTSQNPRRELVKNIVILLGANQRLVQGTQNFGAMLFRDILENTTLETFLQFKNFNIAEDFRFYDEEGSLLEFYRRRDSMNNDQRLENRALSYIKMDQNESSQMNGENLTLEDRYRESQQKLQQSNEQLLFVKESIIVRDRQYQLLRGKHANTSKNLQLAAQKILILTAYCRYLEAQLPSMRTSLQLPGTQIRTDFENIQNENQQLRAQNKTLQIQLNKARDSSRLRLLEEQNEKLQQTIDDGVIEGNAQLRSENMQLFQEKAELEFRLQQMQQKLEQNDIEKDSRNMSVSEQLQNLKRAHEQQLDRLTQKIQQQEKRIQQLTKLQVIDEHFEDSQTLSPGDSTQHQQQKLIAPLDSSKDKQLTKRRTQSDFRIASQNENQTEPQLRQSLQVALEFENTQSSVFQQQTVAISSNQVEAFWQEMLDANSRTVTPQRSRMNTLNKKVSSTSNNGFNSHVPQSNTLDNTQTNSAEVEKRHQAQWLQSAFSNQNKNYK